MRRTYIAIPLVASILITAAVVVALWVIGSASGERTKFSSLEIAPHDTDVFVAINTDPTSPEWLAVNHSLDQINAKNSLRQAIDDALADVNLDWERDIVPVAGDEAFMSVPDITDVAQDHGWVGGVLLSDAAHARDVFETLRTQPDAAPLKEQDYNGVSIFYTEPSSEPTFSGSDSAYECNFEGSALVCRSNGVVCSTLDFDATPTPRGEKVTPTPAVCADPISLGGSSFDVGSSSSGAVAFVDNVMALGASPDDAKAVIDVVQGRAESAKTNARLQDFRKQQKQDFLVWGYADLADVWKQAEDSLPAAVVGDAVDTQKAFDTFRSTYDRVGFSLSSHSEGFAFDIAIVHSPDFNADDAYEPSSIYEPSIAEMLPPNTMFYLSGFDLYNQTWLPARKALDEQTFGDGHNLEYYLQQFREKTGVDLEGDVLSLFTGEMAFAGDVRNFDYDPPDYSLFAIADVNDEAKANSTIETMGDFLHNENEVSAHESEGVWEWRSPDEPNNPLGLAVSNGRLVVGLPLEDVQALVGGGATDTLRDTEDWKRTMELLPQDKTFVGFLSIERILDEVRKMDGAEEDFADSTDGKVALDDLDAIRSIGMATTASDNGFGLHFVLFMKDR